MARHSNCILCQSDNLKPLAGYEKAYLCQCQACGFVFSQQIPAQEELDSYYHNYGVNQYLSPITVKRYNELLDKFEAFRKTNKILDVGCGIGYFLEEAKKRGWQVYGTELSEKSVEICIQKGIKTTKGHLYKESFGTEMFDVITSFEVIEHVNNPVDEITTMRHILRQGGLVYMTTPNFNSLLRYRLKSAYNIINYPEHLSYYTPKTLRRLFVSRGFYSQKIETTGVSLTRFKTSKGISNQRIISAQSDDEKIRNKMDNRIHLKLAKKIINAALTIFGKGDSLKGWFIKQ